MGRDVRHWAGPRGVAVWLPVVVVLALLGGAVAAHRYEVGPRHLPWLVADPETEPERVEAPIALTLPEAAPPAAAPAPVGGAVKGAAVRRALRSALKDPDLGPSVAVAVGDLGGVGADWTWGNASFTPASTTKVLTSVAALESLGPDHRFTTRVVSGAKAGEIVLVGGGDPYLTQRREAGDPAYWAGADLATLAAAVAQSLQADVKVRLRYDASFYAGDGTNPAWRSDYIPDDVVAPIGALMLDGGRVDGGPERADDPALAAAQALRTELIAAGLKVGRSVVPVAADPAATEIAAVQSAPLADIVEHVISVSDNEGAELLAHAVGFAVTGAGDFESGAAATTSVLEGLGVDTAGLRLGDGSGLARGNVISSATMLDVLRVAAASDHPELRAAWTGLPTAGFDGSLAYRFDRESDALGWVRAKTGTLTGVHALAGTVTDASGATLVFVVAADRVSPSAALDAQAALDRVAAALAECACSVVAVP